MFIRKRRSSARADSYQMVETYRENGRVRQRVLANLGPHSTIEGALAAFTREAAQYEGYIEQWTKPLALQGAKWELNRIRTKIAGLDSLMRR
jgi:hypothetical protein